MQNDKQKYREGNKCLKLPYPTAKNKIKVTIRAQKETPHPIKVKVCSVSSSLVVLCSKHEATKGTKPPQISHMLCAVLAPTPQSSRERLLTYRHLVHLQQHREVCGVVAETDSGVWERSYHRAASCRPHPASIWANMQQETKKQVEIAIHKMQRHSAKGSSLSKKK